MGCDIHLYVEYREVERRQKALISNEPSTIDTAPWRTQMQPNSYYDPTEEESVFNRPTELKRWYSGRDYSLFYLLAGVRGHDDSFEPLSEPRGLPDDVCDAIKEASDGWDLDGHSHSYFTLKELVEADFSVLEYGNGLKDTIWDMTQIGIYDCGGDYERVRCVFWFDN